MFIERWRTADKQRAARAEIAKKAEETIEQIAKETKIEINQMQADHDARMAQIKAAGQLLDAALAANNHDDLINALAGLTGKPADQVKAAMELSVKELTAAINGVNT